MANNDKENKIKKFTKEAIGKTLNQFNKEIGMADLVEINKNQDRILNGILSQVNDENTEKTEKSNIITLDNSTDGIVELKEIQGDTNVNVSKIEEMPITHDIGDKEGNVFTLNEIPKGAISIGEIQGNTMVNCNKDDEKELVLMKDLSTQGDNNITLTEGVDGGKVDVALEGNTLVNVSKTKDNTAITMAYTVENSGNHIALQGDIDGSCRPVITGKTLWIDNDTEEILTAFDEAKNLRLQSTFENNLVTQEMIDNGEEVADNLGKYKVEYKVTGKNKLNINNVIKNGYFTTASVSDNILTVTGKWYVKIPVNVKPYTNYRLSWKHLEGFNTIYVYDLDGKTKLGSTTFNSGNRSSVDVYFYCSTGTDNTSRYTNIQIEEGDTATSYESYKESTKTLYLNSPLLEGDTIEEKDNGIYHVHRSELVAYTEGDETSLITDKVNTLHQLAEPTYELIEQSNLAIPSYANGHLDFNTAVPVEKVEFKPFSEELTYLYANTQYTVQFMSDKAITADIILGGTQLLAQSIVTGLNRITITTPETLVDNKLIIDGVGANIMEVVVTDTDREFGYFEGMKSVGEGEDLEVTSANSDNSLSNTQQLTHEPLRGIGDVKDRYVLLDGKWYIERKCQQISLTKDINYIISTEDDSTILFQCASNPYFTNLRECSSTSKSIIVDKKVRALTVAPSTIWIKFNKDVVFDMESFKNYLPMNLVIPLAQLTYEPVDYNPFEVYSDVTHISTNSTIPTNITVKNHGFNCLLKPSTTYTVSSNLGINTVTTGSDIGDSCLRFYDEDTSDITTMKDVLVLEGDWTSKADLIPCNFSGIESCFEQEYDVEKGKYRVTARVKGDGKESSIIFYIDEPLRRTGTVKDRIFIQDGKVVVERKCGSVTLDGSEKDWRYETENGHTRFALYNKHINMKKGGASPLCTTYYYCPYAYEYNSFQLMQNGVRFNNDNHKFTTVSQWTQWLQANPVTVVYQLVEPTYEEVEYSSNRLILNTFNNESFNNSTLFLDTTILPKLSFKPLYEELVYVKNSTKYYIQFNAVGGGEVVINLGGTELTTEIVEGYNCIPITTPSESTNLMTMIGQGITISEVIVSEVVCGGYYKGLQSCFEEHMENGKYRVLLRGMALDGSKVNGIKLYINEPLRGVGDTRDRLCIKDGKLMVERKCGGITFDGSDNYDIWNSKEYGTEREHTYEFRLVRVVDSIKDSILVCNNYPRSSYIWGNDKEGVFIIEANSVDFRVSKTKVDKMGTEQSFKQWLQQNPTTVVYQLKTPFYEEVTNEYGLPIVFEGYENGIVYIDSAVTPTTHIKYTSNNQLATTLAEAEEQNIATQEDINMNVVTYMMDIDMILTEMEMSNDTSVMAVRRDNSNENMLDRMSKEDKKVYQDNTVVMLEKMITANVLDKEDIEGRINMYYDKNRISKEQYEYLKSLL